MSALIRLRCNASRLAGVVLAACAVVVAGWGGVTRAATWTATTSADWATAPAGGWNGATAGVTNSVFNPAAVVASTLPLASTTATLTSSQSTGALAFFRSNYEFTVTDGGNGYSLTTTSGVIQLLPTNSSNASSATYRWANAVDVRFDAGVVFGVAGQQNISNAGAAGRLLFMGDLSQSVALTGVNFMGDTTLGGNNSYDANTVLRVGSFVLDYGVDGGQNATKFADSRQLTLGGGLTRVVLAGGSHEEVVGNTAIGNGAVYVQRDGGSSSLQMNALTFSDGAAVDFGEDSIASTDTLNTSGILSGRATVGGTSWAINSTNAADGAVAGLAAYSVDTFGAGLNTDVTQDLAPAEFTTNSLRFDAAGSRTLTLTGSNVLASGGLLVTPNVSSGTTLITGGTIEAASGSELVIHQHNAAGVLDIRSNINMARGLVKTGSGTLVLSSPTANIGSGSTSIHEGVVSLATSAAVFGSGTVRFGGGTIRNDSDGDLVIANEMILGPDSDNGFAANLVFGGRAGTITLSGPMQSAGASSSPNRRLLVDVEDGVTVATTSATAWGGANTGFTKRGSGTFSVRGGRLPTSATGPLVVQAGVMDFSGNGTLTSGMAVLQGGVLQFDNTATNLDGRTTSSSNGFHLAGGEMKLIGNASVATTQTTSGGPTFVQSGASVMTAVSQGQPTTLTVGTRLGSWSQTTATDAMIGSTVLVRGTQLGSGSTGTVGRLVGNTTFGVSGYPAAGANFVGTTAASIVPWMLADDSATGSGKTLAFYDYVSVGGNGFRPLNLATEVATADAATSANYYFSGVGTTTAGGNRSWKSLQLDGGHTLEAASGTAVITLDAGSSTGGGIVSTGAANTISSSIRLNASNLNLFFHTVTDLAVQGAVTNGSGAFVKSSAGTLTLSGTSNRSTGNTYVNQGVLKVANANGLYDMSTFSGVAQQQRVVTVWGRPGSDTGVLELAGVNWTTGTSRTPGIVLSGNNATLRGSGAASYGNGGAAYLSAYGDVFLESLGSESVFTLDSPISRDSGLDTTINVKGAGKVVLAAGAGNSLAGTSRGNAEMDWYIGGSRNGDDGWLAVNTTSAVGRSSNTFYVGNGGMLSGTGTIGSAVSVQSGGIISPGNSTGTLTEGATTFESGGRFRFEINSVAGTAGSSSLGWDLLLAPALTINATSESPFFIDMVSLTAGQTAGTLFDFEDTASYEWLFVDTDVEVGNFDVSAFQFDVNDFLTPGDPVPAGAFSVRRGDAGGGNTDRLYIVYVGVVPEPGTLALVGIAGGVLVLRRIRRRRPAA